MCHRVVSICIVVIGLIFPLFSYAPHTPDLTLMIVGQSIRVNQSIQEERCIIRHYDEIWLSIGNGLYETQLEAFRHFFVSLSSRQEEVIRTLFARADAIMLQRAARPVKALKSPRPSTAAELSTTLDTVVENLAAIILTLEYRPMMKDFDALRIQPGALATRLAQIHGQTNPLILLSIMSRDRAFIKSVGFNRLCDHVLDDFKKS